MITETSTLSTLNILLGTFTGMSLNSMVDSMINVKKLSDGKLKELLREECCERLSTRIDTRRMVLLQEAIDRGFSLDEMCDLKPERK